MILGRGAMAWHGAQASTQQQYRRGSRSQARPPAPLGRDLCVDLVVKTLEEINFPVSWPVSTFDHVREVVQPESADLSAGSKSIFQSQELILAAPPRNPRLRFASLKKVI